MKLLCSGCKGANLVRNGSVRGRQRWLCKDCNRMITSRCINKMDTEDDKRILMTQHYQRREGNVDVNKLSKELGVNRETMRRWMREEDIKQEVRDVRMLYKELKTCMQLIKSELRVYRDETERRFKKLTKTVDGFATQLKQLRR